MSSNTMLSTLLLSFEAFADSLPGRIIAWGSLMVAAPLWAGLVADYLGVF